MTSSVPAEPRSRPRDSAATRRALLEAARELFAGEGYDRTTVRAIADRAGVNQALLFRHFGNKEGLFGEAVAGQARALLAETEAADLLERVLESMLAEQSGEAAAFFAVLRSAGNSQAADTVRDELGRAYGAAFASLVDTDDPADAALRADLLLAWLLGLALLRTVVRSPVLADADPAAVIPHVLRTARTLLGPAGP